jgi:cell division protein ZapE
MDAVVADPSLLAGGPLPAYRARRLAGALAADPAQELVAERLQELWAKLRGYDPEPKPAGVSLFARLLRRSPSGGADEERPNGLYLAGEVGRGKSMLMDLFFAAAAVKRKRRIHFHRFMQDVHKRIHALKQAAPAGEDPIPPLADAIAAEAALLCFDEFQVNDIADAMILGRLFQALFARSVVVVATSNTLPGDLFKDQPGRDAFLPFIALLKANLDVLVLEAGRDYRRDRLRGVPTWYVPPDARARRALDGVFAGLTGHAPVRPARLIVMGRPLIVEVAAAGVARFEFPALCEAPLGAGDYLALATHFHCLVLDRIPSLAARHTDVVRRFVILIDALYEHRVKLAASAMAWPDALYTADAVPFARTSSRLAEMQSQEYLALPHLT